MKASIPDPLFILEMANNHMGDVEHGVEVIRQMGRVCRDFPEFQVAFKFQYRDLDTFIHPSMQGRDDIKYVKRFSETRLSRADFDRLVAAARSQGFWVMATPFDEPSVEMIESQQLDLIKIASCSFTDWPLLERVAATDLPVVASTAGAQLQDIDRVISFLSHRGKQFAILHCVGEYPTPDEHLQLGQIDFLRARYPGVRLGFSTHEDPGHTDIVRVALAKGATVFEKHVGVATDRYALNAYSANPEQVRAWLQAARHTRTICGVSAGRPPVNVAEAASLRSLQRGVFVKRDVAAGAVLQREDVFFAFPPQEGQITANDWSKYSQFTATADIPAQSAVTVANVSVRHSRDLALRAVQQVRALLKKSRIAVPRGAELELSHHYGMERFHEVGLTLITVVNRGYCKKLLVSLPGQQHPEQYHKIKEETFHVLYGEVDLTLDGLTRTYYQGDVVTVEPGVHHAFVSQTGCVIEEISSTHYKDDSYYADAAIMANKNRKTVLTYWMD